MTTSASSSHFVGICVMSKTPDLFARRRRPVRVPRKIRRRQSKRSFGTRLWVPRRRTKAPETTHGPRAGRNTSDADQRRTRKSQPDGGFGIRLAEPPWLARGFAGREFDDLGRDFLLSDEALAPLQLGKLVFDLLSRRRHRLHARLVLRREGMQSRPAKLRVHIVRRKSANENVRREVQQRR